MPASHPLKLDSVCLTMMARLPPPIGQTVTKTTRRIASLALSIREKFLEMFDFKSFLFSMTRAEL